MPIEKRTTGGKLNPKTGKRTPQKTTWKVRLDTGRESDGTRTRQFIGTYATKTEAKRALAKAITDRDGGTLLLPDSTTMDELFDKWIADDLEKTVALAQRPSYVSLIDKHLRPAIGTIKARKLQVAHVEDLLNGMTDAGYSSSQVTKARMRIAQALDLAVRRNLLARNVARDAKPPKLEYEHGDIWTPAEIGTFMQAARDDDYWPLWQILAETGCRQSEALGLTWELIDLEAATLRLGEQVVRVDKGKPFVRYGGKTKAAQRTLPISAALVAELKAYRKEWAATKLASGEGWNPDGLLFVSLSGGPVNPTRLREHHFKPLLASAKLPKERTMHQLRNAAISALLAAGIDPGSVAKRAGHSSSKMVLDVYQRINDTQQKHMTDILAAVLNANSRQEA